MTLLILAPWRQPMRRSCDALGDAFAYTILPMLVSARGLRQDPLESAAEENQQAHREPFVDGRGEQPRHCASELSGCDELGGRGIGRDGRRAPRPTDQ